MRFRSIKTQLIVSVLLVELASAVLGTTLVVLYEQHARFRAFDIMLRGRADSLLAAVQDAEDAQDSVMLDGSEINLPHDDIYEVWDENGRVLGHSPAWKIPSSSNVLATSSKRFEKIHVNGTRYRTIRMDGVRVVDPGDKNGGGRRRVTGDGTVFVNIEDKNEIVRLDAATTTANSDLATYRLRFPIRYGN